VTISSRQLDRTGLEAEVLGITRGLLEELGNRYALDAVRGGAHLERDLGLGSLDRVELLVRIDRALGTRLPERVMAEADTLDDVIAALGEAPGVAPERAHERQHLAPAAAGADALAGAETWQDVLRYRARNDTARAHILLQQDGAETALTFGELYDGAAAVAAELGRRGVTRGDAVALMLPTSRDFFLVFAGVLLAGGVPVPIYPPMRADRIAEYAGRQSAILRNAEARLLVTFREAALAAKLLRPRAPTVREVVTAEALLTPRATSATATAVRIEGSAGDLALLQYTSGSTGDPKGVMLTHANLLSNVRAMGEAIAVRPDDVCVSWLPLYHDMGLIGMWLAPLYFGLPVVILSPTAFLARPEQWLWALNRYRGTLTAAPNFAFELTLRKVGDDAIEGLDLSAVRGMMNGAEPVKAHTLERFAARFARCGLRRETLTPVYGLAEGALAVTVPPLGRGPRVDRVVRETFEREGHAVPAPPVAANAGAGSDADVLTFVSVGHPVPKHAVRIVDGEGRDTGERVEGKLWFAGPSTTQGYFRNEEATRSLLP
jgi:fatty-acyl-CoA synthase